jgi:hypothetical protein
MVRDFSLTCISHAFFSAQPDMPALAEIGGFVQAGAHGQFDVFCF